MNALLVRVAADSSGAGGSWNGPVDSRSWEFVYAAIPEGRCVHPGLEKPYSALEPALRRIGVALPGHLHDKQMHLDPDFTHLTYGDVGQRGKQILDTLKAGDAVVFYAGLADICGAPRLVYAVIGLFVVEDIVLAGDIPARDRDINAHSRRILARGADDIVVHGRPGLSGRLKHCLPFGEYRDRAYRVRRDLLEQWGGLSVKDGYVQRSVRLPRFLDPMRFLRWLERQQSVLVQSNN